MNKSSTNTTSSQSALSVLNKLKPNSNTNSSKSIGSKKSKDFKHNLAKKTDTSTPDDVQNTTQHPDEEAHSLIEHQAKKDNDKRVDILEKQVSAIKGISLGLTNQLKDDEQVISTLSSGFDRTRQMLSKTFTKMDEMVSRGSTSVWTYVVIFVIIFLALLYKLG